MALLKQLLEEEEWQKEEEVEVEEEQEVTEKVLLGGAGCEKIGEDVDGGRDASGGIKSHDDDDDARAGKSSPSYSEPHLEGDHSNLDQEMTRIEEELAKLEVVQSPDSDSPDEVLLLNKQWVTLVTRFVFSFPAYRMYYCSRDKASDSIFGESESTGVNLHLLDEDEAKYGSSYLH